MTRRIAEESDARFDIQLDHGPWEECIEAIKLGFNSIMCDFAHLPFEENIRFTKRIVEIAHDLGIPVEAELGKIPDVGQSVNWEDYYTTVDEATRFVAETGVDYLAISVGIVHGVIPGLKPEPLSIKRTLEIRDATKIPLVLRMALPAFLSMKCRPQRPLACTSSTPTRIFAMSSARACWMYGRRGTISLRTPWPRAASA
jgi:fructose-bisphosphate aldolase, class II